MIKQPFEKIRLDVEELPALATDVAIAGSTRQQEVGGPVCIGILLGVAVYSNG